MAATIPAAFRRFMEEIHGAAGRAWLATLPATLVACAQRWDLTYDAPFPNLTYHYVIPATRGDGRRVVVKCCSPTGEYAAEAALLDRCGGRGLAALLDRDDAREVLLVERLEPGTTLRDLPDDAAATRIAAGVMRDLWRPPPAFPFATVADWRRGLDRLRARYGGGAGPFPADLVALAERRYAELSATAAPPVALHGDLHHDNILRAGPDSWRGIDPKGLIGEPAYEAGAWLRNWLPDLLARPDPSAILAGRVAIFAAMFHVEPARIQGWGVYQAVLAAWWTMEDSSALDSPMLTCARLLAHLDPASL